MINPHIIRKTTDPVSAPPEAGIHWINTVSGKEYFSVGTSTLADWVDRSIGSASWGTITGTLSSQTDLQSGLDSKANIAGDAFTGAISSTADLTAFAGTTKEVDLGDRLIANASTALEFGGALSINADPTRYDISAGQGRIVDYAANTFKTVSWLAKLGNLPTLTAAVYIYIDTNGNIVESNIAPTPETRRDNIFLGRVVVITGTVAAVVSNPVINLQVGSQIYDFMTSLGIVNITGNRVSPNGANLSINKSSGLLLVAGANFSVNHKDPHRISIASSAPTTFQHLTQTQVLNTDLTSIIPTNYDLGGVVTAIPGSNNQATNMRVFLFPSGNIRIQYGQVVYGSLSAAVAGLSNEAFVINAQLPGNSILIGVISVTKGATALNDAAQALFTPVSRFGESFGGASGGTSTTTLQQAYNNSTANPEILTDSIRGPVTLRRGSAADADDVIEVQSNAGTKNFSVSGNGAITALTYNGYVPSNSANNFLSTITANVTNSTISFIDTGIQFPVLAGERWAFVCYLQNGCNNTGGLKYIIESPTASELRARLVGTTSGNTAITSQIITTNTEIAVNLNTVNSQGGWAEISGIVDNPTNAGDVKIRIRSIVDTQTSTFYKESYLYAYKI